MAQIRKQQPTETARLAEYNTLRDEIVWYLQALNQCLTLAVTIFAAVTAALTSVWVYSLSNLGKLPLSQTNTGLQGTNSDPPAIAMAFVPVLFNALALVLTVFVHQQLHQKHRLYVTGRYIAEFLEPPLGLRWETLYSPIYNTERVLKSGWSLGIAPVMGVQLIAVVLGFGFSRINDSILKRLPNDPLIVESQERYYTTLVVLLIVWTAILVLSKTVLGTDKISDAWEVVRKRFDGVE